MARATRCGASPSSPWPSACAPNHRPPPCAAPTWSCAPLTCPLRELLAQGATQVRVLPLFLGTGKHAREDLPVLMDQLRQSHQGVEFHLQTAVGEDPRMLDLMARIALGVD